VGRLKLLGGHWVTPSHRQALPAALLHALLTEEQATWGLIHDGPVPRAVLWAYARALPAEYVPAAVAGISAAAHTPGEAADRADRMLMGRGRNRPQVADDLADLCFAFFETALFDLDSRSLPRSLLAYSPVMLMLLEALRKPMPRRLRSLVTPYTFDTYNPIPRLEREWPDVMEALMERHLVQTGAQH
jgi:hypothetical protein